MKHGILVSAAAILLASSAAEAKLHLFGSHARSAQASKPKTVAKPEAQPVPYQWTTGAAPKAHRDLVATFGRIGLKPGEYLWAPSIAKQGETRVVIDRLTQMAYVYRADQLVGAATTSTATRGRVTPLGNWSVLEKRPFYRSKKYGNAPMPFMQRIDSYGIALHGGGTPGFPESHGCIHLPMKFAEKLYGLTRIGTKVVIEG